jgi:hypothetical protein
MWRHNHLPLTARIRHSHQELLQICLAEVKCLCGVWVKCLSSHSTSNYRLNWNLHVRPGHSKEFAWTISRVSHVLITTNDWCSGKQHNLIPSGPWLEPMPWQIIFATFRDLCLHVGPWNYLWRLGILYFKIILTCGTKVGLWRRWHGENAYMWNPRKIYDDLEHSIFEKMLTCGTLLNFMTTWNNLFLK